MSEINAEVGVIGVDVEIQNVVVNPVVAEESAPAALFPIMTAEQTQSSLMAIFCMNILRNTHSIQLIVSLA